MKKVLFVIQVDSYFKGLVEVAKYIKNKQDLDPVIYFPRTYPSVEKDISTCFNNNIEYIKGFYGNWIDLQDISSENVSQKNDNPIQKIISSVKNSFIYKALGYLKQYNCEKKKIQSLLNGDKYELLIQGGDNIGHNNSIFINICHKNNIPSVLIPAWMAGPLEAFEAYKDNPANSLEKTTNKIIGYLFPYLLFEHLGEKIIRWDSAHIAIMYLIGLIPPKPWALHSGYADCIFAESHAMYDYMIKEGLPASQIKLVGSIHNDIMSEVLSKKEILKKYICKKYNIDQSNGIILTALPPDQLYGSGRPDCEFNDYNDLLSKWINPLLKSDKYNVIISLHPSHQIEDYEHLNNHRVTVSDERIIDLIPLCDIFVASISATIQWAIACGKPVINYDVYRFRYTDYEEVRGVVYVDNMSEYVEVITRITNNTKYYENICKIQKIYSNYWGVLDGKSGERIADAINGYMKTFTISELK